MGWKSTIVLCFAFFQRWNHTDTRMMAWWEKKNANIAKVESESFKLTSVKSYCLFFSLSFSIFLSLFLSYTASFRSSHWHPNIKSFDIIFSWLLQAVQVNKRMCRCMKLISHDGIRWDHMLKWLLSFETVFERI